MNTLSALQAELATAHDTNRELADRIKQLSLELREKSRLLNTVWEHTPFGLVVMDHQRNVVNVNRAAQDILGVSRAQMIGRTCSELLHCWLPRNVCPLLDEGKSLDRVETPCMTPGRTGRVLLRSSVLVTDRNERLVVETFVDISELKAAEQSVVTASRAKDAILDKMSHELRTPLNAVIGFSELLLDDARNSGLTEYVDSLGMIHEAGERLLKIATQVMDLAQLRGRTEPLDMTSLQVSHFTQEIAQGARSTMCGNNNTLAVQCDVSETLEIRADPRLLQKLLFILLENADKFTTKNIISLSVDMQVLAEQPWVRFCVRDSGKGMKEEEIKHLFQDFGQADNTLSRAHKGTGLGLSIAHQIAILMGGAIAVESTPGVGSAFTFSMPAQVA